MKDIVLILSDQHCGFNTSIFSNEINTPNLQTLAKTSTVFSNCYCNCPLCVPSRMSFLTGKMPNKLKIFDNNTVLASQELTLADYYNQAGYRTILVGRMHFKGSDQYHGFQERYVGDITTQYWGEKKDDLGVFKGTFKMKGCLNQFGYGSSPVDEYDQAVCAKVIELLKEEHQQPLFMIIGFYSPHFPYCSAKKYFDHYFKHDNKEEYPKHCLAAYADFQQSASLKDLKVIRASYYGMIEALDNRIGQIKKAYDDSLLQGLFIYTSDHGEQLGRRGLFGKRTLYEHSIKVPLFIENSESLQANINSSTVSLLDLHHFLLNYLDKKICREDLEHKSKPIHIMSMLNKHTLAEAIIKDNYKLVQINQKKYLYNLILDPNEEHNIALDKKDLVKDLSAYLLSLKERQLCQEIDLKLEETTKNNCLWTKEAKPKDTIRYKFKNDYRQDIKRGK